MKKLILSACLVAGTSIGAGMIALPMVLCKIGILPAILLIISVWFFMYVSGMLGIELNLRADKGLPLGKLGYIYSGKIAASIGSSSLILLIYALLCAYLYGGASVLQGFFSSYIGWVLDLRNIILIYAFLLGLLLLAPISTILQVNRLLFTSLLFFLGLAMGGLFYKLEPSHLPLLQGETLEISSWAGAIPVLFTSYGFHVIFHTLTNFCDRDPLILKRTIFWGSMIPAIVYIGWTLSTLGVLYYWSPHAYQELVKGELEVGQFVQALAHTAAWPIFQLFASVISLVAILKSSIGVGLGLFEAWQDQLKLRFFPEKQKIISLRLVCALCTLLPPLIIALLTPHLFLKALRFAGMVLVIIAIFLPLWLIRQPKARQQKPFFTFTNHKGIQLACLAYGALVIACEFINLLQGAE
jgi:tyrosine-specific transport protein